MIAEINQKPCSLDIQTVCLLYLIFFLCPVYLCLQNVTDGDLCEQFNSMDPHKQKSVAEELDRTPPEVSKKLEDIRTRYAF